MILKKLVGIFVLGVAATASAWTNITWKAAADGALDTAEPWDLGRVPGYVAGKSDGDSATLPEFVGTDRITLTLNNDFLMHRLNFTATSGASTEYVMDFPGKTLTLSGVDKGDNNRFCVNEGAQVTLKNGTVACNSPAGRPYLGLGGRFVADGAGAVVQNFIYFNYGGGSGESVVFTNGACYAGCNNGSTGGDVLFTGDGTKWDSALTSGKYCCSPEKGSLRVLNGAVVTNAYRLWCGLSAGCSTAIVSRARAYVSNGGVRIGSAAAAGHNRVVVSDGAYMRIMKNSYDKGELVVGLAGGDNTLVVSGAQTKVVLSGPQYGTYIGKGSDNNLYHVTDGAEVTAPLQTCFGPNQYDSTRYASCANNCLLVDKGASYTGESLILGNAANRDNNGTSGPPTYFTSNSVVFASGAKGRFTTLSCGTQTNIAHSVFRAEDEGTEVTFTGGVTIGTRGLSNRLEVVSGALVDCRSSLVFGNTLSTGACISVTGPGSQLAITNYTITFYGAAPRHKSVIRVADGGLFRTGYLVDSGKDGLLVDIDDGVIEIVYGNTTSAGYCKFMAGTSLRFRGRNATLRTACSGQPHIGFEAAVNLHFEVPEGGFAHTPIDFSVTGQNFRMYHPPTVTYDLDAWRKAGGGRQVLLHCKGGFSYSTTTTRQAVLDAFSANLPETGCRVYFANEAGEEVATGGTKIVLRASSTRGLMMILR